MSRGRHAGAKNLLLREELAAASEARRRLEHRLSESERERADLAAWKAEAKRQGLPDLRAERKRNDDLSLKLTLALDEARRQAQEHCDEVLQIFAQVLVFNALVGDNEPKYHDIHTVRLSELCSPEAVQRFYACSAPGVGRQNRRDLARMPGWAQAGLRDNPA